MCVCMIVCVCERRGWDVIHIADGRQKCVSVWQGGRERERERERERLEMERQSSHQQVISTRQRRPPLTTISFNVGVPGRLRGKD